MNTFIRKTACRRIRRLTGTLATLLLAVAPASLNAQDAGRSVDQLQFNGEISEEAANFTFTGSLKGGSPDDPVAVFSSRAVANGQVSPDAFSQTVQLTANLVHGQWKEIILQLQGEGEIATAEGDALTDWSVRRDKESRRYLVLRIDPKQKKTRQLTFTIEGKTELAALPGRLQPLILVPVDPSLHEGLIRIGFDPGISGEVREMDRLTRINAGDVAEFIQPARTGESLAFRFFASMPQLALVVNWSQPDANRVVFEDFSLAGDFMSNRVSFVLQGRAVVRNPKGGRIHVLSGEAALTELPANAGYRIEFKQPYIIMPGDTLSGLAQRFGVAQSAITAANALENDRLYAGRPLIIPGPNESGYQLVFDKPGEYPVRLKFDARILENDGWRRLLFRVIPSALQEVVLNGLPAETEFRHDNMAAPVRRNDTFVTYLNQSNGLDLQWKSGRAEETGRLFYSMEGLAQVIVSPGLLEQNLSFRARVMQGELSQLRFNVSGPGEIVRVTGKDVLEWKLTGPADTGRVLLVQFNQAIKADTEVLITAQAPLGEFPLAIRPMRFEPQDAIRTGGQLLVANDGSVRLEVTGASGLSQISPDHVSERLRVRAGAQQFAYRFSDAGFDLTVQADNIVPEVSVSQVSVFQVGENETTIETDLSLEIREAPIREFLIQIPSDYVVTRLNNAHLSDYFITPGTNNTARLRIVFASPVLNQESIYLRLERNRKLEPGNWTLPHVQPLNIKSMRGQVGVAADTGLRLTTQSTNESLTDLAPSFFPRKVDGLQLAWRWRDPSWEAVVNIERLALFVQADVVHLFSIGEGIANGSTIVNYLISGAPVSLLTFNVPTNYTNLEFTGRDVRSWKQAGNGYEVHLNAPASGTYTLLVTYDRQFAPQGATLSFIGVEPTGVQAEQGYVLVISDKQFQIAEDTVSSGLIRLEPGEIPKEHTLLFEAPLLESYQYLNRPFTLDLKLSSLEQGGTQDQVIDRAEVHTEVSSEGQVLTTARLLIKSQGRSHLRITLPKGVELWSSVINGTKVVPVTDEGDLLIPLPQGGDPNAVLTMELNLANKSDQAAKVAVHLPVIASPILQTTWKIQSEANHRLLFQDGTLKPVDAPGAPSGIQWAFSGDRLRAFWNILIAALIGVLLLRWAHREGRRRFDRQHVLGSLLALLAFGFVVINLVALLGSAPGSVDLPQTLTFNTPFLETGTAVSVALQNLEETTTRFSVLSMWPAILGFVCWAAQFRVPAGPQRAMFLWAGWILVLGAALRAPLGGAALVIALLVFFVVHVLWPALNRFRQLPSAPDDSEPSAAGSASTALLMLGLFLGSNPSQAADLPGKDRPDAVVTSLIQQARVTEGVVQVDAVMQWSALEGQSVEFLNFPAVLMNVDYPKTGLMLTEGNGRGQRLNALKSGAFEIRFSYQLNTTAHDGRQQFRVPTPSALVNRLELMVINEDVEVTSGDVISQTRSSANVNGQASTRMNLVLGPGRAVQVAWQPRSRDTSTEEAVFYGEFTHLLIPQSGIVEGLHDLVVRPGRGQLEQIELIAPAPFTITDVLAPFVSAWRFDPDAHTLRVQFVSPQSRTFALRIYSQIATSTLPYVQAAELMQLVGATEQIGKAGVATGSEVQLESVNVEGMIAVNLEDYPSATLATAQRGDPTLTLRRAYRYEKAGGRLEISAAGVEPDIRVVTQETLSLGDDRTVLAVNLTANITRAGIFKLSFALPPGLEVESLSGESLSHWTELNQDDQRIVTLNLKGRTEGQQTFMLTLSGPGLLNTAQLTAPRIRIREAAKQQGQLTVVPELGVRLHVSERDGITELDPKALGIRQRGAQAFRLLQGDWRLVFDLEQVEPWVQVNSLQDVAVHEGQVQINTRLDYQIENAGVNTLRVRLPVNAESVSFTGEHITDSIKLTDGDARLVTWEVRLSRRVTGAYSLSNVYKLVGISQTNRIPIDGVLASAVNLQRGFVTVRSQGRLEVRIPATPPALAFTDWQGIPARIRSAEVNEANHAFRIIEPDFTLNLQVIRHQIAPMLPARVVSVNLDSTMSSGGELLTEVRMDLHPGDKRLLQLKLPAGAEFWFAFVNGESASPWKDGDKILIPLEANSDPAQPATVEFFYTSPIGNGTFDRSLAGPEFDLPLQNITWTTSVAPGWQLTKWDERWQYQGTRLEAPAAGDGLNRYFSLSEQRREARTRQAEALLQQGNDYLQRGDQQLARKAYRGAMELSQHDAALNEDARVQLQNLKQQQTLVGLNLRMGNAFTEPGAPAPDPALQLGVQANYSQQQAKQLIEANSSEDNAAMMKLADKLVRQQEATQGNREAIRATLPHQSQQFTFTRSLHIDTWSGLELGLNFEPTDDSGAGTGRWGMAALMMLVIGLLLLATRRFKPVV